jgi:hypothetical protein
VGGVNTTSKLLQITHFDCSTARLFGCSGPSLPRIDDVVVVQNDADYETHNEPESSFQDSPKPWRHVRHVARVSETVAYEWQVWLVLGD